MPENYRKKKKKGVCLVGRGWGGYMEHLDGWTHSSFQHPSCAEGPKATGGVRIIDLS